MSETTDTSTPTAQPEQLPDKIVQLLATPTLTNLPENLVGAVLSAVRRSLPDYELVELPEFVSLDPVAAVVGAERMQHQEYHCHQLTGGRILRSDTSMPMLVDTAATPGPCKRIAAGKVCARRRRRLGTGTLGADRIPDRRHPQNRRHHGGPRGVSTAPTAARLPVAAAL